MKTIVISNEYRLYYLSVKKLKTDFNIGSYFNYKILSAWKILF